MNEKTILKKKTYTIEVIEYSDGTTQMSRRNNGFYVSELLGYLEFTRSEIMDQVKGAYKPDFVKREVVTE